MQRCQQRCRHVAVAAACCRQCCHTRDAAGTQQRTGALQRPDAAKDSRWRALIRCAATMDAISVSYWRCGAKGEQRAAILLYSSTVRRAAINQMRDAAYTAGVVESARKVFSAAEACRRASSARRTRQRGTTRRRAASRRRADRRYGAGAAATSPYSRQRASSRAFMRQRA